MPFVIVKHGEDKEKIAAEIDQLHAKDLLEYLKAFCNLKSGDHSWMYLQELHLQLNSGYFRILFFDRPAYLFTNP